MEERGWREGLWGSVWILFGYSKLLYSVLYKYSRTVE